jgi:hypothetical protein
LGVWGTGLFQDDTACDVRDDFKDHLGDGLSGPDAKARILAEYKSSLADPHDAGVVWLILAAVQWRYGRLDTETLEQALQVIDSGSDLERWKSDTPDFAKRKKVLEKLRIQITSPQPIAKKVRKHVPAACDWPVGAVISYRLISGNLAILRVIGFHTDKGGTSPVCELLDWTGTEPPSEAMLRSTNVKESNPADTHKIHRLMLLRLDKSAAKKIVRFDFTLEPFHKPSCPQAVVMWKQLDVFLKRWFQLE